MEQLALSDIQGFLIKEYKEMSRSEYFLLQVTNAPEAKKFIASITENITTVAGQAGDIYLNIGFTNAGLGVLGLKDGNKASFSREFREGMVTPHRQRLLGDFDSSAPEHWNWGGPGNEEIHILLMVFGRDEATTNDHCAQLRERFSLAGIKELHRLSGYIEPDGKEHFGFREGISQPAIIGSGVKGINNDNVNPGEFLMGHKNEYGIYPDTPLLKEAQGDMYLLTDDAGGSGYKDLGCNGTYFVLRQLKEDVDGFWNFLNEHTKNEKGIDPEESTKLAAKMMGRWPSGAPLVKFPDKDPGGLSDDNDFNYIKEDKMGYKCPFGAHARRANPRDNFEETGPSESLKLTRRHRIIRRTRLYGERFTATPTRHTPTSEVGIFFGCFNADISRQFEFIQYTWANYPKFKQLYADPDPFIGVRETPGPGVDQNFTIPRPTANECITGLKSFVFVKGGGYFFFPSVTVTRFLSSL